MVKITEVEPHSRAEKQGVRAGDALISLNGHLVTDVLDYRFYLADTHVDILVEREGKALSFSIDKDEYDDIGLDFATPLMDKKHSCENKCIFCFIDQLPKGLRSTLYFKDDDSRLSFLHGNYITLTNLHDHDIDRIIEMHISPVNVSVHTTNPALRVQMMHNKRAGEVLSYLRRFADARIALCGQIVLCRGINDGEELSRTMHDLTAYLPALRSVAIVPAGLTRYREKLYPLTAFSPAECASVIAQVNAFGDECKKKYGSRIFAVSDEFYLGAGLPLPGEDYYEGYSQLENGVGMLTSFGADFHRETEFLDDYLAAGYHAPRRVSIATGVAAYDTIRALAAELEARVEGLEVTVHCVINHFFGESITVAGLLTGKDMSEQLAGQDLGDELLIPSVTLRAEGDLFLCGMTPAELSEKLGVRIGTTKSDNAMDFINKVLGTAFSC